MESAGAYFSPDYFTARDRFREASTRAGGSLESLPLSAAGAGDRPLSVDIAWFGTANPQRVLLHSSGLHGVEGFAGSAIQLHMLSGLQPPPSDTAIVVVHILNPYGMAWLRRANENNVDLNRNFRCDKPYAGAPSKYAELDSFLNPRTPPRYDFYLARAAGLIWRHGMTALKQSVVGGQYEFPKGLFFGGKHMEEGPKKYAAFLKQRLGVVEKAVVIDVHTGLGKFGEDTLLVDHADFSQLRRTFGERITALEPDQGAAYRVEGGMESMIFRVVSKSRPIFVCQELGTYSSTAVLHALREENRWHHYGRGSLDHRTKRNLKEKFCPASQSWRAKVVERGRRLIEQAMSELSHER